MKLFLILIIFTLNSQILNASSERQQSILKMINEEIKTISNHDRKSAMLYYRLFELNHEKLKIVKAKENDLYIKGKTKASFAKSKKQYLKTKNIGLRILKKYRGFKDIGNILYVLGVLEVEFGEKSKASFYLEKALGTKRIDAVTLYNIKVSLAEFYYNEKMYAKAINLYKEVVKNEDDKWRAKHYYNLAWCTFKTNRFNSAYSLLKKSYALTNSKKFLDIKDQVLKSTPLFFYKASRVKEAVAFLVKDNSPIVPSLLLKLAVLSQADKEQATVEKIISRANQSSLAHKDYRTLSESHLFLMKYYRNKKQIKNHYNISLKTYQLKKSQRLSSEVQDEIVNELKDYISLLQVKNKSSRTGTFKFIPKYFKILAVVDNENAPTHYYHLGEYLASIGMFDEAFNKYSLSLSLHGKKKNKDLVKIKKVLTSMLFTYEAQGKKVVKKEIFIYKNYLSYFPRDKKALKLYPKLFNSYFSLEKNKLAIKTLKNFSRSFPKQRVTQRALMSSLLAKFIKLKDSSSLATWINRIEKGFLNFPKTEVKQLTLALGEILFGEFHKLEKSGKYSKAIASNLSLFESEKYPRKIKIKAAQNISILSLKILKTGQSYSWLKKASKLMTTEELIKETNFFQNISQTLMDLQEEKYSGFTTLLYLSRSCKEKPSHAKMFLRETLNSFLITGNAKMVSRSLSLTRSCPSLQSLSEFAHRIVISNYIDFKNQQGFVKMLKDFTKTPKSYNKQLSALLLEGLEKFFWRSYMLKETENIKEIISFIPFIQQKSSNQFLTSIIPFMDAIAKINNNFTIPKKLDESNLQAFTDSIFENIESISNLLAPFLKLGHVNISKIAYLELAKHHELLAKKLQTVQLNGELKKIFSSIPVKVSELSKDYKKQGIKIIHQTQSYDRTAKDIFSSNNTLTNGPTALHNATPIYGEAI